MTPELIILKNAELLHIDPPLLVKKSLKGLNVTALYSISDDTIYYDDSKKIDPKFLLFELSHEMRHVWQYDCTDMLEGYKTRDEFESSDEYNLQLAEIDANAWGIVVCANLIGEVPTLDGLSAKVQSEIDRYIRDNS